MRGNMNDGGQNIENDLHPQSSGFVGGSLEPTESTPRNQGCGWRLKFSSAPMTLSLLALSLSGPTQNGPLQPCMHVVTIG